MSVIATRPIHDFSVYFFIFPNYIAHYSGTNDEPPAGENKVDGYYTQKTNKSFHNPVASPKSYIAFSVQPFLPKQSEHFCFHSKAISPFIIGIAKGADLEFYHGYNYFAHGKFDFEKVDIFLLANGFESLLGHKDKYHSQVPLFRGPAEAFGKSCVVDSPTRPTGGFDSVGIWSIGFQSFGLLDWAQSSGTK